MYHNLNIHVIVTGIVKKLSSGTCTGLNHFYYTIYKDILRLGPNIIGSEITLTNYSVFNFKHNFTLITKGSIKRKSSSLI